MAHVLLLIGPLEHLVIQMIGLDFVGHVAPFVVISVFRG